jgi:hypothetical protein
MAIQPQSREWASKCCVLTLYILTLYTPYTINIRVVDASFFTYPRRDWQKRYEALRASFVERLPAHIVAERFGYTTSYIHLLRHQFKHGKLDFAEPPAEGSAQRRDPPEDPLLA